MFTFVKELYPQASENPISLHIVGSSRTASAVEGLRPIQPIVRPGAHARRNTQRYCPSISADLLIGSAGRFIWKVLRWRRLGPCNVVALNVARSFL